MNITVSTDDLAFVSQIEENFGLPTPLKDDMDEIFGDYSIGGFDGFLKYAAETQTWSYIPIRVAATTLPTNVARLTSDKQRDLDANMAVLSWTRPTELPDEPSKLTWGEPFHYGKWRFVWLFIPQLWRWELKIIDHA